MPFQLTPDIAARIASRLPDGRSVDNLRIITAQGTIVSEPEAITPTEKALIASQLETAGGPPMLTNGVPTIMRIVAWLGHEGKNNNGLAFVGDELGPAADRIREPNFLLMDFNHSAVLPFSFDQKAIGVWYKAEKRWDPKANNGLGAYGILAQGIMWAWAFPDYATTMLAEQERDGVLKFSMACLPETVEIGHDATGTFEIAHNPVFLTLSALDVAPADPAAVGFGKEGSTDPELEDKLTQKLVGQQFLTLDTPTPLAAARNDELTEEQMDELKVELEALKTALEAANAKIETLAGSEAQVAALTARVTELESQLTEANTAKDAVLGEAAALKASLESVNAELVVANEKLATIAAKEEEAAKAERYTARLAELPEAYRAALANRSDEEQTKFATKWTNASDADWSDFKNEIVTAFSNLKVSYLDRSRMEGGRIITPESGADDIASMVSSIKR